MLWTYGLTCSIIWQIAPNTIYDYLYMYLSLKIVVDAFFMHFEICYKYQTLWVKPMVMVAYSLKSLVLKSLVVEMHKHVYQKQMNKLDVEVQNCSVNFLKNLKTCGVL